MGHKISANKHSTEDKTAKYFLFEWIKYTFGKINELRDNLQCWTTCKKNCNIWIKCTLKILTLKIDKTSMNKK